MSKIVYKVVSPAKFIGFLKKFSTIENTLLVEIQEGEIKAKTHTPDRSVVKSSRMPLEEILEVIEGDETTNLIFGLYNIEKFANSFKHFTTNEFNMLIEYDKLEKNNVGTQIILSNQKLTINFDCASYRIFTHISDDLMAQIAGTNDEDISFELDKNMQSQISSLCSMDSDGKFISFKTQGKKIKAVGKSFNLEITESSSQLKDTSITFYKKHFNYLDREDCLVIISDEKIVFKSSESNTLMVVGKTEE